MYVLNGGPRAGQLVDDLPDGYAVGDTRAPVAVTVIGGIPATRAHWESAARRLRLVGRDD